MGKVSLRHVYKIFESENKGKKRYVEAVKDFSMEIEDNEFIVFVGPSGCGKSTTLRMIAGLEDISKGEIYIDDLLINELEPKDRNIAMVFQNYALYPHMTAYKNIAFSLRLRKIPVAKLDDSGKEILAIDHKKIKALKREIARLEKTMKRVNTEDKSLVEHELDSYKKKLDYFMNTPVPVYEYKHMSKEEIDRRVRYAAKILDIESLLDRKPREMSGGQRQRIALGRAIVRNPKVFLLDEPLSNLDAKLRAQMRAEITSLHNRLKTTFIYVTHDQIEAMTMGTRIVVMKDGIIQQIDTPNNLFNHPKNVLVAGFIGTPQMNFFKGDFCYKNKQNQIILENGATLKYSTKDMIDIKKEYLDGKKHKIILGVRGEDIFPNEEGFIVKTGIKENLGNQTHVYFNLGNEEFNTNRQFIMVLSSKNEHEIGKEFKISFDSMHIHLFDADTEESLEDYNKNI